jgi:2-polyprenyl-6-methoxyphenol hydroxylase-like FAD-dependent oxidoreductase
MPEAAALTDARPEQTFDVLEIGAGPAGLCCAIGLAQQGLDVGVIERQGESGIALTHRSIDMLKKLGVWPRIGAQDISPLRDARRETLGLLVPNHAIRAAAYQCARAESQRLHGLNAEEFNGEIERKFAGRRGAMTLTSTRHIYPLVGTYSRRFVAERCALIGDAAVGMHPVTAHGFNLGLQSQACLADELQRAKRQGGDIGAPQVLSRYESAHRRHALPLYLGTNALVRLYTDARPLPRIFRSVGLRLAQRVRPLKDAMLASLK